MEQPPKPTPAKKPLTKWQKLKLWVAKRHDYLEKEYQANNIVADGLELGVFRKVFEAMNSFEEQEAVEAAKKAQQQPPTGARRPRGM